MFDQEELWDLYTCVGAQMYRMTNSDKVVCRVKDRYSLLEKKIEGLLRVPSLKEEL